MEIDLFLFNLIHGFADRSGFIDGIGIFFARFVPYLLVLVALWILVRIRGWRHRFYFFSLAALALIISRGILTEVIRFWVNRPRPFELLSFTPLISHDAGGSFPSGHATAYFALSFIVFLFLRSYPVDSRRWGLWFLSGSAFMALARVFAGVHWLSDVLGGAAIGLGSAYLVWKVLPLPEPGEGKDFN